MRVDHDKIIFSRGLGRVRGVRRWGSGSGTLQIDFRFPRSVSTDACTRRSRPHELRRIDHRQQPPCDKLPKLGDDPFDPLRRVDGEDDDGAIAGKFERRCALEHLVMAV